MDYGVGIRTIQQITENDKCRNFFLTQAVNLDLPRYITDVCSGAPLSIGELHIPAAASAFLPALLTAMQRIHCTS